MNNTFEKSRIAQAKVIGNSKYPDLHGTVMFRQLKQGVLVNAELYGLPDDGSSHFFGFHIHRGESCTGNENDMFADAGTHFNPDSAMHPFHAGDLPPLLSGNGKAYMSVLTNRVNLSEIIGKTVIIHKNADDFTTQPSGNSGEKIACGRISLIYNENSRF